jgi:methylenetetrahydrofolate--tRNA-(uracil-5-)-methyltransferase
LSDRSLTNSLTHNDPVITVVGGGFAGVEAAWAAAQRGARVRLMEMRPARMTPAHTTGLLCELVCSNSLKSKSPTSPGGLLKAEMVALGSLVVPTAEGNCVPGGEALAVDREAFAREITETISSHPNVELVRFEVTGDEVEAALKEGPVILATGPLTSPTLAEWLAHRTGREHLYFYDAVSPTVEASSVDAAISFAQSRYDKGGDDYLNCPFDKEQYLAFVRELVAAERTPLHEFEEGKYFAGCTPIEEIASKGERSLAFGNFKPVGLTDPRTGRRPCAALQLRPENRERTLYSLVACQTRLKWGEQKRVFSMVPGLANAEFVRLGVIHRNTYIEAPKVLQPWLELRETPGLFVAGQLTGVEGYVESAAMGILAGIAAVRGDRPVPPRETAFGSLVAHLQDDTPREFAPMNVNWGLLPDPPGTFRDKGLKREAKLEAAHCAFEGWARSMVGAL